MVIGVCIKDKTQVGLGIGKLVSLFFANTANLGEFQLMIKPIKEMLAHKSSEQIILDLVSQYNITKKLHPECLTALKMIEKGLVPGSEENIIAVHALQDCGLVMKNSGSKDD